VIDLLAEALKIDLRKKKFGARYGLGESAGKKLILLKPWQFMNRSGQAVATAAVFYKLDLSDLLVVTDDMDLEPGRIRFRPKGSAGGHNGLADIIDKLGTNEFARCRIGIGRSNNEDAVDYVLDAPPKSQLLMLADAIERARNGALCWIEWGIDMVMNKFNNGNE
jgi:PTH1 family peptidyl-tRNA hydrolase